MPDLSSLAFCNTSLLGPFESYEENELFRCVFTALHFCDVENGLVS
jgi:hypothetical protein